MGRHFEEELRNLKEQLIEMASVAEQMVTLAREALTSSARVEVLSKANDHEERINEIHLSVDEKVGHLLALQQPVARDFRFIIMATKIANELERIGDLCVNVCESARYLSSRDDLPTELTDMAQASRRMVSEALDAFSREDAPLAQRVLDADQQVDMLKRQILHTLIAKMTEDPASISRSVSCILISRNWERIGDHATNIAEEVIYLVQGREVRHRHETTKRQAATS